MGFAENFVLFFLLQNYLLKNAKIEYFPQLFIIFLFCPFVEIHDLDIEDDTTTEEDLTGKEAMIRTKMKV